MAKKKSKTKKMPKSVEKALLGAMKKEQAKQAAMSDNGEFVRQFSVDFCDCDDSPTVVDKKIIAIFKANGGTKIFSKKGMAAGNPGRQYSVTMPDGKSNVKAIKQIEKLVGRDNLFRMIGAATPTDQLADKLFNG